MKNCRCLTFTASSWTVRRDVWSADQLTRIGIDSEARSRLVQRNLLVPVDGSCVRRGSNGSEFEVTRDALALFAFARAAAELQIGGAGGPVPYLAAADSQPPDAPAQLRPRYVVDLRELVVACVTILELPTQARTLAVLLKNLEQGQWKVKVHCPLQGHPDAQEPQHLYDAASRLSRRQPLIEFHADDGGCRWEWKRLPRLLATQCCMNDAVC